MFGHDSRESRSEAGSPQEQRGEKVEVSGKSEKSSRREIKKYLHSSTSSSLTLASLHSKHFYISCCCSASSALLVVIATVFGNTHHLKEAKFLILTMWTFFFSQREDKLHFKSFKQRDKGARVESIPAESNFGI